MEIKRQTNPWKGLNYYIEGEVLYGRTAEIISLSQFIFNNTQTVLYGRSGIGKSSILNAGIFPKARNRGMIPVSIRLKHDGTEPYIAQIRQALKDNGIELREIVPVIDAGKETLWEFIHRHEFISSRSGNVVVPLFVFDQFEEIFTLQRNENAKREFFSQLADLLNDVKPLYIIEHESEAKAAPGSRTVQGISSGSLKGLNIELNLRKSDKNVKDGTPSESSAPGYAEFQAYHIVFALREDFLSSLELYTCSIPVMKNNRYGLLPINEEQAADIIMQPVKGLVNPEVTTLIIQKVTGRKDFTLDGKPEIEVDAAILSLYLSRLYLKMPDDQISITEDLVNTYSGHIIQDFYEESIESDEKKGEIIRPESIIILEDCLLTKENRRNNVSRNDILHLGVSEKELDILINERKLLRQFQHGNDIRIEYIHDILCDVVKERIENRELIKKQEIENARNAAEKEKILLQQRRERSRFRRTLWWSLGIIVVIISAWGGNYYWNEKEYSEYYKSFTRRNGWPVGIGKKLNETEVKKQKVTYKLTRKGRSSSKPFSQVEVCSPNGKVYLPDFRSPMVGYIANKDTKADEFASLNMKVRTIRFTSEKELTSSKTTRESYYDAGGSPLYSINYYYPVEYGGNGNKMNQGAFQWAVYVDKNGLPMKVRDNGADRMKIFLSSDSIDSAKNGLETKYLFYDEQGSPQLNDLGAYGFRMSYNEDLTIDSLFHLDPFSLETMVEVLTYEPGKVESSFYSTETGKPINHNNLGYARRINTYDTNGNICERRYFDVDNREIGSDQHPAGERLFYDDYNRLDSVVLFDNLNKVIGYKLYRYPKVGNIPTQEYRYRNTGGDKFEKVYTKAHIVKGLQTDYIEDDVLLDKYRHERIVRDTVKNEAECIFLDKTGKITFDSLDLCSRYVQKKIELDKNGYAIVTRYYDSDNNLYKDNSQPDLAAVDSVCYDADGCKRAEITFDADGNVLKSMCYDYKDGVEISRYALSLDGHTPIRCPQWETDGLCYYKLNNVKNSRTQFNLAYIQAISPYPECSSYVYFHNNNTFDYKFDPVELPMGENWIYTQQTSIKFPPAPKDANYVQYLHITNLAGNAYKAGLRDGDLVLNKTDIAPDECLVKVLRYNRETNSWHQPAPFRIPRRNNGMEIYPVAYTQPEYSFYMQGLRSHEK